MKTENKGNSKAEIISEPRVGCEPKELPNLQKPLKSEPIVGCEPKKLPDLQKPRKNEPIVGCEPLTPKDFEKPPRTPIDPRLSQVDKNEPTIKNKNDSVKK